jgi:hypothetical protein
MTALSATSSSSFTKSVSSLNRVYTSRAGRALGEQRYGSLATWTQSLYGRRQSTRRSKQRWASQ